MPLEAKREIPDLLVTIAKRAARDPLLANLPSPITFCGSALFQSLNKLHTLYPDMQLDATTVETVLPRRSCSHYQAYQILGRMDGHREQQSFDRPLQKSMHHELERIFRLLKMLYPKHDLRSAFVGLESGNKTAPRQRAGVYRQHVKAFDSPPPGTPGG